MAINLAKDWLSNKENRTPQQNNLAFAETTCPMDKISITQQALFLKHYPETFNPVFIHKRDIIQNLQLTRLLANTQLEVTKSSTTPLETKCNLIFNDNLAKHERDLHKTLADWSENPTKHNKERCCVAIQVANDEAPNRQMPELETVFRQHIQLSSDITLADLGYETHVKAIQKVTAQAHMTEEEKMDQILFDAFEGNDENDPYNLP